MSPFHQLSSRWLLTVLVLIAGLWTTPASAEAGLDYTTYNAILERGRGSEVDQQIRQAQVSVASFDLRAQEGSVVSARPQRQVQSDPSTPSASPREALSVSRPDRTSINIVAEVGLRARIIEDASYPWQPRGVSHARVSAEVVRPGKHLVPYVAIGRWDNLISRYVRDQWTGSHTTFAVAGLALRSRGNPQAGQVVFQANGGFGYTWGRDQRRTTARHIFEGTVSASYHITRRMAVRVGYAHYSTGEGVIPFMQPRGYFQNRGEGRATIGLTLRV